MKRVLIFALLSIVTQQALAQQTIFYGGDPTGLDSNNYFATVNGFRSRMVTFDDFTWNSTRPLNTFFGEFISNMAFSKGHYEIRTGISSGFSGILLSSGDMNVTSADEGQSNVTGNSGVFRRYFVEGSTSDILLTLGATYFVSFSIDFQGNTNGQGAILRTNGVNGVGTPLANGNLYHDQPGAGLNYSPRSGDVAYGLRASSVPEMTPLAFLSLGIFGLLRAKSIKQKA
jgi:hypothetical protein